MPTPNAIPLSIASLKGWHKTSLVIYILPVFSFFFLQELPIPFLD